MEPTNLISDGVQFNFSPKDRGPIVCSIDKINISAVNLEPGIRLALDNKYNDDINRFNEQIRIKCELAL